MILLDILFISVCIIIGFQIKKLLNIFDKKERNLLDKLFFYHIGVSVIFYYYIKVNGGDAYSYWYVPKLLSYNEVLDLVMEGGRPTEMMFLINYFFSNTLNLSFLSGNIFYGLFGYCGFVFFLAVLKDAMPLYPTLNKIRVLGISIFPLILFMPNLHFWSAGVGKDTLLFFCISLFAYSILRKKVKWIGLVISLGISFIIRPHITLFLLTGFGIGLMLDGRLKGYMKFFSFIVLVAVFIFLFDSVLSFVKIDEFNAESFTEFADSRAGALSAKGGSTVDISGYPYPLKIFTFLFRPLFFDMNNIIALVASFENLFLLLLFIKFFANKGVKSLIKADNLIKGAFFFFVLGTLSFSLILGNLGIMLRQKNMFMLMAYLFLFWGFYSQILLPRINRVLYENKTIDNG